MLIYFEPSSVALWKSTFNKNILIILLGCNKNEVLFRKGLKQSLVNGRRKTII